MTSKQSSPLPGLTTGVLLLSCLVTVTFSQSAQNGGSNDCRPLHSNDRGVFLRRVVQPFTLEHTESDISSELVGSTTYKNLVCPLVEVHSRLQKTLDILSEDDERRYNIHNLTFIIERQTVVLCHQVRENCTENNQHCSNMSCNVSSIIETCLHVTSVADRVESIWGEEDYAQNRDGLCQVPLWLNEFLEDGYPDSDLLDTIEETLETFFWVQCIIPKYGSNTPIECARDH